MYNHNQLLPAACDIIEKLEKYLKRIVQKPASICANILDPQNTMSYFEVSN